MKNINYIFFILLFFSFICFFTENAYSQETTESIKSDIAAEEQEELRLLQEERRIIRERNAERRRKIEQAKRESKNLSDSSEDSDEDINKETDKETADTQKPDEKKVDDTIPQIATNDGRTPKPPLGDNTVKTPDTAGVFDTTGATDERCSKIPETDNFKQYSITRAALCQVINDSKPRLDAGVTDTRVSLSAGDDALVRLVVSKSLNENDSPALLSVRNFLLKTEKVRTDKQIGSDVKSNGTTSIVSKGGIPAIFAFAVENGAAVSSIDGTTMTFRVNPTGVLQALKGADYVELLRERRRSPWTSFFSKTSLGFSFDTKRGFDETPTFTGSERQLSAFSFRYEFINERNPSHSRYQKAWKNFVSGEAQRIFEERNKLFTEVFVKTERGRPRQFAILELQDWLDALNAKLKAASPEILQLVRDSENSTLTADIRAAKKAEATEKIETIIAAELDKLPVTKIRENPGFSRLIASVELDAEYIEARRDVLNEIAQGQVATFEYINSREPIKPDTHSLRFIWEKGLGDGLVDFTVNASMTFYNKQPNNTEVRRLRDFDFSGQFDIPLRQIDLGILKDSVLSFAGRYQRLNTDIIDEMGFVMPGTKGDIALGQVKFTIPIGDTGIKIPISFTAANRTELIKEKEVRGNFGITFDFDSIFARLKAFSPLFPR